MSKADNQHLQVEYEQANENMRHYANMRFAQLTLFAAITAGLWSARSDVNICPPWLREVAIGIGGAVPTAIFWLMEERAADYWHHFRRCAVELEETLGYTQHTGSPQRDCLSATNAVRVLYSVVTMIWIWLPFASGIERCLGKLPDVCCDWLIGVRVVLSLLVVGVLVGLIRHYRQGRTAVTNEQPAQAESLEGTTMPDGAKHE